MTNVVHDRAGAREAPHHPVMSVVLVLSALLLVYGAWLTISLIQEEDNAIAAPATDLGRRLVPTDRTDDAGTAEPPAR